MMTFLKMSIIMSLFFISIIPSMDAARILGVLPHAGKSHFFVFEPYMKALAAMGHDVTVISHFPQKKPLKNYRDISVEGAKSLFKTMDSIDFEMFHKSSSATVSRLLSIHLLGLLGEITCESTLSHPAVQELLNSNEKFDLVVSELFSSDCLLGFAHKYGAPHISLSSCVLLPWSNNRFGIPAPPAYIPFFMGPFSDKMDFLQRMENTLYYVYSEVGYYFTQYLQSQEIANKYFGQSLPDLRDLAKNTSLILVNSHHVLNIPRPMVPAAIEIGGIHLQTPKKLPKELDQWISEAKDGVIFFSLGSNLRTETLPADKRSALLAAFSELPQRVLWKWEGDTLPGQPDNVRIGKWLPQYDILNHPNVRLFISHCGLLSSIEIAQSGMPIVGIPIFADQYSNYQSLEDAGIGVKVEFQGDFTKEEILTALRTVLNNSTYAENAKRLSTQFLDRPHTPMETAIFWTEYVIRHKGAHHLRSAAVEMPYYQFLLLDIILAILAAILIAVFLVYYILKKVFRFLFCKRDKRKQE